MNAADLMELAAVRQLAGSGRARAIRERAGLSLAEVGDAIGVTAAAVCRWETGTRRPRGEAALAYGRLLRELGRRRPRGRGAKSGGSPP